MSLNPPRTILRYKKGYKYQVLETLKFQVDIYPLQDVEVPFLKLSERGELTCFAGYAWDGPSGPAIDTDNFMNGSLAHDALYQLMRMKKIASVNNRKRADKVMKAICLEDGMTKIRAAWVYAAVRTFARRSSVGERPVLEAP